MALAREITVCVYVETWDAALVKFREFCVQVSESYAFKLKLIFFDNNSNSLQSEKFVISL